MSIVRWGNRYLAIDWWHQTDPSSRNSSRLLLACYVKYSTSHKWRQIYTWETQMKHYRRSRYLAINLWFQIRSDRPPHLATEAMHFWSHFLRYSSQTVRMRPCFSKFEKRLIPQRRVKRSSRSDDLIPVILLLNYTKTKEQLRLTSTSTADVGFCPAVTIIYCCFIT
jgi:hypothetical protein